MAANGLPVVVSGEVHAQMLSTLLGDGKDALLNSCSHTRLQFPRIGFRQFVMGQRLLHRLEHPISLARNIGADCITYLL